MKISNKDFQDLIDERYAEGDCTLVEATKFAETVYDVTLGVNGKPGFDLKNMDWGNDDDSSFSDDPWASTVSLAKSVSAEIRQDFDEMKSGLISMAEKAQTHFLGKARRNKTLEKVWGAMEEIHLKFSDASPPGSTLLERSKATGKRLDGFEQKLRSFLSGKRSATTTPKQDEPKYDTRAYLRNFKPTTYELSSFPVNDQYSDIILRGRTPS